MARAKRERVVQGVLENQNRTGPTRPDPTRPPARPPPPSSQRHGAILNENFQYFLRFVLGATILLRNSVMAVQKPHTKHACVL